MNYPQELPQGPLIVFQDDWLTARMEWWSLPAIEFTFVVMAVIIMILAYLYWRERRRSQWVKGPDNDNPIVGIARSRKTNQDIYQCSSTAGPYIPPYAFDPKR